MRCCCCCCCCCYIGKSFRHSWHIQYGRFIDIVLISLLFSQFSLLDALWLTKSSKLFKTLYCTQNFLPTKIWKFGPLFTTSLVIPPKPHDIPFGNSNRENGTTFLKIFHFFWEFSRGEEPTKRVPFAAKPEILEILTKWKAPIIPTKI